MKIEVTALYTSLLGLLFWVLSARVMWWRFYTGVGAGDDGDPALRQRLGERLPRHRIDSTPAVRPQKQPQRSGELVDVTHVRARLSRGVGSR